MLHSPDGKRETRVEALVDTGATHSWAPDKVLKDLGCVPEFRQSFRLADGSVIERDATEVRVGLNGTFRTTIVVFGDADSEPLLGAVTLEQFCLAPDPVGKRLVPVQALLMSFTSSPSNSE